MHSSVGCLMHVIQPYALLVRMRRKKQVLSPRGDVAILIQILMCDDKFFCMVMNTYMYRASGKMMKSGASWYNGAKKL